MPAVRQPKTRAKAQVKIKTQLGKPRTMCDVPGCSVTLSRPQDVSRHKKRHDAKSIFDNICPECGHGMRQYSNLAQHMDSAHGKKAPPNPNANKKTGKPREHATRCVQVSLEPSPSPEPAHVAPAAPAAEYPIPVDEDCFITESTSSPDSDTHSMSSQHTSTATTAPSLESEAQYLSPYNIDAYYGHEEEEFQFTMPVTGNSYIDQYNPTLSLPTTPASGFEMQYPSTSLPSTHYGSEELQFSIPMATSGSYDHKFDSAASYFDLAVSMTPGYNTTGNINIGSFDESNTSESLISVEDWQQYSVESYVPSNNFFLNPTNNIIYYTAEPTTYQYPDSILNNIPVNNIPLNNIPLNDMQFDFSGLDNFSLLGCNFVYVAQAPAYYPLYDF